MAYLHFNFNYYLGFFFRSFTNHHSVTSSFLPGLRTFTARGHITNHSYLPARNANAAVWGEGDCAPPVSHYQRGPGL